MVATKQSEKAEAVSAAVLLALALLIGGGGTPAPMPEMVLQVASALAMGWWLYQQPEALQQVPRPVWWIAGLIAALHLTQLIPLPPSLWQALPGRSPQAAALELVQAEASWRPVSLSPARTLASLLCALAALGVLLITSTLGSTARWRLIQITALAGLATVIVGALQVKGEAGNVLRFYNPEQVWLTGFQANRNSSADLILIALLAVAALLWRMRQQRSLPGYLIPIALVISDSALITALFLTGSRTGLALLPLVLLTQFTIIRIGRETQWLNLVRWTAGAIAIVALTATALRNNRTVAVVLDRFTLQGEFRPELWRDSIFALGQYWPTGSGQGTFVPVMIAAERLEVVDPTIPNRAHNDFLELAIEGGLPALLALLTIGVFLLRAAWRAQQRESGETRVQALFAASSLCLLALHSLVDYPLRSMALAALAAATAGMLFPAQTKRPGSEESQV